jgi:hypothetical protein
MPDKPNNNPLMQYAGFAAQLAVGLLLAVYAGMWIDKRAGIRIPLLIWLLPLLLLIGMLIKVVKDTSKK